MGQTEVFQKALQDLIIARQEFDMAAPEYIDVACHKLNAAEAKFAAVLREMKGIKRCHNCSNPHCPYPSDGDFRDKLTKDPSWAVEKDCFIPFEEV